MCVIRHFIRYAERAGAFPAPFSFPVECVGSDERGADGKAALVGGEPWAVERLGCLVRPSAAEVDVTAGDFLRDV